MTDDETTDDPHALEKGYLKFRRKPAKTGDAYVFWIPSSYVKHGLIDTGAEYDIFIKKHPKGDGDKTTDK